MLDTGQLQRIDGRTRHAKRLRALIAGLTADLGRQATTADRVLIERMASATVRLEAMERAHHNGEPVIPGEMTKLTGVVARCHSALFPRAAGRKSTARILDRIAAQQRGAA
ncbi:hypothetical protein [Bradyrhizobium sp. USDA 4473]